MSKIIAPDFTKKKSARPRHATSRDEAVPDYRLLLELAFSSPPVWRRITVSGRTTLAELHTIISTCFGWNDEDGHGFWVGKRFYGPVSEDSESEKADEAAVQLHELESGMGFIFTYIFDAGSGWECEITLEETLPKNAEIIRPCLEDGEQANPPLEFIDIHDYQNFLVQFESSSERETRKLLADHHLSRDFDPEFLDVESLNNTLHHLA